MWLSMTSNRFNASLPVKHGPLHKYLNFADSSLTSSQSISASAPVNRRRLIETYAWAYLKPVDPSLLIYYAMTMTSASESLHRFPFDFLRTMELKSLLLLKCRLHMTSHRNTQ